MKTSKEIIWAKAGLNDNSEPTKILISGNHRNCRRFMGSKLRLSFLDVIESWALSNNYYVSRALEYLSQDSYGQENTQVIHEMLKWLKLSQADCIFRKKYSYLDVIEQSKLNNDYYQARTLEHTLEGKERKEKFVDSMWWFKRPEGRKGFGIDFEEVIYQWNLEELYAQAIDILYDGVFFKDSDKGIKETIRYLENALQEIESRSFKEMKNSRVVAGHA